MKHVSALDAAAVAGQRRRVELPAALPGAGADESLAQARQAAARTLHLGAGVLALAVLADSGLEHYRGSFQNRAMFAPIVSASLSLAAAGAASLGVPVPPRLLAAICKTAEATGVAGLCFHAYNILKRPSRLSWLNLFYAAPIGAPAALTFAGILGDCAVSIAAAARTRATLFGQPAGRVLAGIASAGIAGTVGEAGLLHFRGAYHNPAMFLPVSIPPAASALVGASAAAPQLVSRRVVRASLWLTALLGAAGVGFHVYGVSRDMGGWRNWTQNILNGPPIPAPPGFVGFALAGLAAIALMDANDE